MSEWIHLCFLYDMQFLYVVCICVYVCVCVFAKLQLLNWSMIILIGIIKWNLLVLVQK